MKHWNRNTRVVGAALLAFALLGAAPASAHNDEDSGLWMMWLGQGNFGDLDPALKRWRWWLDVQGRWRDQGETLETAIFRPAVGYSFTDRVIGHVGYAAVHNDPPNKDSVNEDRIWEQLIWNVPFSQFALQSRSRLEERFVETGDDMGWRFREFVKYTNPLNASKSVYTAAYDELFFELNDTDWGQRAGLRQNRAFLGLGFFLDEAHTVALEVGYLNQWIDRPNDDRVNHVLAINMLMNF